MAFLDRVPNVLVSTGDVSAPTATNAAATVTKTADPRAAWVLGQVFVSYDGAPTAGNLVVQDGTNVVRNIDITAAGEHTIQFRPALRISPNSALTVTLAAGGAVKGKTCISAWNEPVAGGAQV